MPDPDKSTQRTNALARLGYGGIATCREGRCPASLACNRARSAHDPMVSVHPLTTKLGRRLTAVKTVGNLLTVSGIVGYYDQNATYPSSITSLRLAWLQAFLQTPTRRQQIPPIERGCQPNSLWN